jgi:hypothetical protein
MPDVPDHRETELAPQDRLATVEPLLPRFLREVLGWDPEDCLVTDGADLFDFACATASRAERQAQVGGFLACERITCSLRRRAQRGSSTFSNAYGSAVYWSKLNHREPRHGSSQAAPPEEPPSRLLVLQALEDERVRATDPGGRRAFFGSSSSRRG